MKMPCWVKQSCGVLLALLGFSGAASAVDADQIQSAADQQLPSAIAALQKWVTIPSVTDATDSYRDDKTRLLTEIVNEAEKLGFEGRLVADQRVAIIDFDQQTPAIGILLHADVVPPGDLDSWKYPPFSGQLAEQAIWGRGAADDKGPIAATLYALAAIRALKLELAGGVRVIVGTSEENMVWDDFAAIGDMGVVPEKGWTADAAFPVVHAEKSFVNAVVSFADGGGRTGLSPDNWQLDGWQGGSAPNSIPAQASLRLRRDKEAVAGWIASYVEENPQVAFKLDGDGETVTITAIGKAGHGSRPDSGVNAITHLARMITRRDAETDLASSLADGSAAGRALQFLGRIVGGATDGSSLGIDRTHPVMGKTTVNVGQVLTDDRGVHSYLNIRGPVGLSAKQIESALVQAVAPLNGVVSMVAAMDPLWVDPDEALVQQLLASYRRWVDDQRPPIAIGGTTYAKAFPGYVAFGMGFPDHRVPVHAPNERMPVEVLRKGMAIYIDAILSTAGIRTTPPNPE